MSGLWVNAAQIGTLMIIAGKTGQGEVVLLIGAVVLSGNDMLDLKGQFIEFLPHATVLAAATRSLPHETSQLGVHQVLAHASDRRAFDLRREMKCPMRS